MTVLNRQRIWTWSTCRAVVGLQSSGITRLSAAFLFLFLPMLSVCQSQTRSILCHDGNGIFNAEFRNGVAVHVGAARERGVATLATRSCAAKLRWDGQELLVATGASQLDLDAFGVDIGDGTPIAAFQVKKSDSDCCMDYQIYSLEKPPRLLHTIKGGESFGASDKHLDGSIEIWTNDAAAVDGFEASEHFRHKAGTRQGSLEHTIAETAKSPTRIGVFSVVRNR